MPRQSEIRPVLLQHRSKRRQPAAVETASRCAPPVRSQQWRSMTIGAHMSRKFGPVRVCNSTSFSVPVEGGLDLGIRVWPCGASQPYYGRLHLPDGVLQFDAEAKRLCDEAEASTNSAFMPHASSSGGGGELAGEPLQLVTCMRRGYSDTVYRDADARGYGLVLERMPVCSSSGETPTIIHVAYLRDRARVTRHTHTSAQPHEYTTCSDTDVPYAPAVLPDPPSPTEMPTEPTQAV